MIKHVVFALTLTAASTSSLAAESEKAPIMTLALYDGSQAQLLQPVALEEHTEKTAEKRVHMAVDALNEKLSKQLDAKFAQQLRATSR